MNILSIWYICEWNRHLSTTRDAQLFMLYMNIGFEPVWFKIRIIYSRFFFIVRQLLKYLIFGIWNFCRVNQLESFFLQFFFVKMVHYSSNGTRYMRHKVKSKWFMFEFGKDAGEIHFKLISHTANHTKTSYLFC